VTGEKAARALTEQRVADETYERAQRFEEGTGAAMIAAARAERGGPGSAQCQRQYVTREMACYILTKGKNVTDG